MVRRAIRVLVVGVIFLTLANLWERQGALITLASQAAMAVPPVPALAALLLLLALLRPLRRIGFDRRQIIAVYCFLTLAVALTSGGAMRFFLPSLPSLFYFAAPENNWEQFHEHIPGWMVPRDEGVIQAYFEGAEAELVPWGAWLGPLSLWLLFFLAFFGLQICLALIFRPEWEDSEHLIYPLAELPLMFTGERHGEQAIWRDGLFWVGFVAVCGHHALNIANAFNPGVAALGLRTDLSGLFEEWPLSAIRPLQFAYRPFMFGLGYLMPTEILISTVVFFLIYLKGIALGAAVMGLTTPGLPYGNQQAGGAFLGMALLLVVAARGRIASVFRSLAQPEEGSRPLAVATIVCALGVAVFWRIAGMNWLVLCGFFGLAYAFAIAHARVRAESGFPHNWIRPLSQERDILVNVLGTERLAMGEGMRSLTLMSSVFYMARGYLPQLIGFPLEAFRIGGEMRIRTRHMVWLMVFAVVLGSVFSWWMHLSAYYQFGANILEGGTTAGGYRVTLVRQGYDSLANWARGHEGPKRPEATATAAAFALVLLLAGARRIFLRFPLHPVGLLIALTEGYNAWGMLLLVWIIKTSVLRIGGMSAYRRLIPMFIGIVIGHYVAAGLVWSLIASYGGEGFDRYPVWF
ncbi:MAG: DUF6785 family protein [Armatimonadota bacterium]|jgi:hypothetical protein